MTNSLNTISLPVSAVKTCLEAHMDTKRLHKKPILLLGAPGLGKSQVVKTIAAERNLKLYDLRLSRMEATDISGLPFLDMERQKTVYFTPDFLPTEESYKAEGYKGAIIFLDELTQSDSSLQSVVLELVLDRSVGNYKVPDNVFIVAAGNRPEDNCGSYELIASLLSRFIVFSVESDPSDWINWALFNNIHPSVIAFIKTHPEHLIGSFSELTNEEPHLISSSPRSWETVSTIVSEVQEDNIRQYLISGVVGLAAAQQFFFCLEQIEELAGMDEYLALAEKKDLKALVDLLPTKPAGLYGLSFSLPAFCSTEKDYVNACYVFYAISTIEDHIPRGEIVLSSMLSLFKTLHSAKLTKIISKVCASKAYKAMRLDLDPSF